MSKLQEQSLNWIAMSSIFIAGMLFLIAILLAKMLETMIK
jgi:hypothetical protein